MVGIISQEGEKGRRGKGRKNLIDNRDSAVDNRSLRRCGAFSWTAARRKRGVYTTHSVFLVKPTGSGLCIAWE